MQNYYELTERGKIVIAIVLVLLILVLPSAIIAYNAWASTPPPPDEHDPPSSSQTIVPPIEENPSPPGDGFDPPEVLPPQGNGESSPPYVPPDDPEFGLLGIDPAEGTLSFLFSPELQDSLDDETASKLGEFLASPKNRPGTQIAVEMPILPETEKTLLISVVASAFASHGVSDNQFAYITYQSGTIESSFEVKLSFISAPDLK